jgi:hypothetical protein
MRSKAQDERERGGGKELEEAAKVFAPIKQSESIEMPDNGAALFE